MREPLGVGTAPAGEAPEPDDEAPEEEAAGSVGDTVVVVTGILLLPAAVSAGPGLSEGVLEPLSPGRTARSAVAGISFGTAGELLGVIWGYLVSALELQSRVM